MVSRTVCISSSFANRLKRMYIEVNCHPQHLPTSLRRTSTLRIITRTGILSPGNAYILKHNITTTSLSTQHIIIDAAPASRRTSDVLEQDVLDDDAVGWDTGWPAVEVILLDVDTVVGGVGHEDVLVGDVGDVASGVEV